MPHSSLSAARAEALAKVSRIDGWLTDREAGALFDLASQARGPIIEIGSWRGRSTAALALGAQAGTRQPVFAVDSFIGVPPGDRPTVAGIQPGWHSSSPEALRRNLDAAGVNGGVTIVPYASQDALPYLPSECDVLFVDGGHDYPTVRRDFELYLPRVRLGGSVLIHDCWEGDPDVVRAVDDVIAADPLHWRRQGRIDSALLCTRRETLRHRVFLAVPGPTLLWQAARGLMHATLGAHEVTAVNSGNGWDDMNYLWVQGINAARRGAVTHFAMLHADVEPSAGWLDVLLAELDDLQADLISTVVAIKDRRGLTSCGAGTLDDPWDAFRRFTVRETLAFPETFGIADTPHPDKVLLHNTGCWACDLRQPLFQSVDAQGNLRAYFNFPLRVRLGDNGEFIHQRESEDWFFSRRIHELGVKSLVTRKVEATHFGSHGFPNSAPWGAWRDGDEDSRHKWSPSPASGDRG